MTAHRRSYAVERLGLGTPTCRTDSRAMDVALETRKRVATALALIAAIAAVALLAKGCYSRKGGWVKENNRLIDRVPLYPGAVERGPRETRELQGGRLSFGWVLGYYTIATYRVPRGTTWRQFSNHETKRLPRAWRCRTDGTNFACYTGKARILIEFNEEYPPVGYVIQADKGYKDDRDSGN